MSWNYLAWVAKNGGGGGIGHSEADAIFQFHEGELVVGGAKLYVAEKGNPDSLFGRDGPVYADFAFALVRG